MNAPRVQQYRIVMDGSGSGGMLCPPGHPNLFYTVCRYEGRRREPDMLTSITEILDGIECGKYGDVPQSVRARMRSILDGAELVCSEMWLRTVYGYFRGCYSPDGVNRNVSDFVKDGPPEHHLAVLMVREFFPDHEPRADLIHPPKDAKLYGAYGCTKCGQRVQYEARVDALAVYGKGDGHVCPADGAAHMWADGTDD